MEKDGKKIKYYPNGKIGDIRYYKNGEIDGIWEKFWENGNKDWTNYYENGNIKSIRNYKNGECDEKTISYYENGNVKIEDNGKDDSNWKKKWYYENGQVLHHIQNRKHIRYYENGNKSSEWMVNENNNKDGLHLVYFENGQKHYEENLKDGEKEGMSIWYHDNGSIFCKDFFPITIILTIIFYFNISIFIVRNSFLITLPIFIIPY